eukprot:TRINITY_DN4073_c0_g1_i10.p1 TRINITY_DN4073_c0_g1~~TRINITY_DN4073_c0_g1_i10.p1  ORF type:complete len:476 (+),score=144.68 TRINITY_DN4073_c0_g1_i10:331-1758(+)
MKIYYDGKHHEIPLEVLELDSLTNVFSTDYFHSSLSKEEQESLRNLLPQHPGINHDEAMKQLFAGDPFFFGNPLKQFLDNVKYGCYTKTFEKEKDIEYQIYENKWNDYSASIQRHLMRKAELLEKDQNNNLLTGAKRKRKVFLEDISSDTESSYSSISQISIEHGFEELSHGNTTIDSAGDDYFKTAPINDLDVTLQENRKIEAQRALQAEAQKNKKTDVEPPVPVPKEKAPKAPKNQVTIKQANSKEWIENYRKQERERYANPTKPYTYTCPDGTKANVAPVAKKISISNAKPREHFLLKTDRPSYITILCLVRDAAARLPSAVGTRADICELLKESQFINENIPDDKASLSNIVSGALDRLHYEDDPCVKYDSEKKLWIYLHRDRGPDEQLSAPTTQSTPAQSTWSDTTKDSHAANKKKPESASTQKISVSSSSKPQKKKMLNDQSNNLAAKELTGISVQAFFLFLFLYGRDI